MKVLLDTSVLIAAERDGPVDIPGNEVLLPSVAVLEYRKGVEKAGSEVRRRRREAFFDHAFGDLEVLPLDVPIAKTAARIWHDLEAAGSRIPPFDLLIAATAIEHDLSLATGDPRDFSRVDGLELVEIR